MFIETLRSFRVGPFAVFDIATAYIGIYLVAPYLTKLFLLIGISVTRAQWLWLTLPIALLVHVVFGIDTALTRMVLNPSGHYIAKLVVAGMFFMGIWRR
jgi:hypothetical protein